ncbi:MAG TPA: M12 family metallopeptidase [Pyrinomonadaceae bacterium]|nr:M12 family metallopeptidase [Pyrinomonadaceae bacterium]
MLPLRHFSLFFFVLFLGVFSVSAQKPTMLCLSDSLPKSQTSDPTVAQGVFRVSSKWLPGQKLRVKFLDGSEYVKLKVKTYAQFWEQFANVDFVFVDSGAADIRISFQTEKGASWSLVGKTSQNWSVRKRNGASETYQNSDGTSMNFGWFDNNTSDNEFRRTTLHEFGHALGLLHEHQNMNRDFEWNKPVVLNYYMNELGWSRDQVENQVFYRYGNNTEYSNKAYDKFSIMHYSIDPSFTKNGIGVGSNTNISAGDKALIAEMYPFNNVKSDSEFKLKDISTEFNVTKDNLKGMNILLDFNINKAYKEPHLVVVYFYTADGKALKDSNKKFYTVTGNVAALRKITPGYERTVYTDLDIFMPYNEFELPCGEYRLKYYVGIWQDSTNIANSGYSYFTYKKPCN